MVTLAEIQTALSAAAAGDGAPESPRSGEEQHASLPVSPGKVLTLPTCMLSEVYSD